LPIRIAYLEEFKGSDTLLVDGDLIGLKQLATALDGLSLPGAKPIHIETLPFVSRSCLLRADIAEEGLGVSRAGETFTWLHTSSEWATFSQQINELTGASYGHHYLDSSHSDIQVLVTHGEGYDHVFA